MYYYYVQSNYDFMVILIKYAYQMKPYMFMGVFTWLNFVKNNEKKNENSNENGMTLMQMFEYECVFFFLKNHLNKM